MSYKKIIIGVLLAGVLNSCSKDITVEKFVDQTWEVNDSLVKDDIRYRIGYDPRYEYGFLEELETEIPMLSLEGVNLPLTGENKRVINVDFTNPIKKDAKLTLEYDADAFEQLKSKYPEYELGSASLVKMTNSEVTFVQGTTSGTFEISVENDASVDKKYIVPFTIKVKEGDDHIKLFEDKKTFVVKVYPQKLTFEATPTSITKRIVLSKKAGTVTIRDPFVAIQLATQFPVPAELSVGLVRDDTVTLESGYSLAPAGVEGTLPKESIHNVSEVLFNFQLENIDINNFSDYGKYILPLKWVLYDASGTAYDLPIDKYYVEIQVNEPGLEENPNNSIGSNTSETPSGTPLIKYNIGPRWFNTATSEKSGNSTVRIILDGKDDATVWFKSDESVEQGFIFTFYMLESKVKTIRLKMRETHTTNQISVFASDQMTGSSSWKTQGVATFEEGQSYYVITFDEPISPKRILLKDFKRNNGVYFEVYEVDFYSE